MNATPAALFPAASTPTISAPQPLCGQPRVAQLQVGRVELGRLLQERPIEDFQAAAMKLDQPFAAQLLERPVDVNRRQAERVTEVSLRERELARVSVRKSDRLQAKEHLAEEVRQVPARRALTEADNPRAENGGVDERVPPKQVAGLGRAANELADGVVRDECH